MTTLNKRATIYFDPEIHKALKLKALETSRSVSDLIDEALRHELAEDLEDLRSYRDRVAEPTVSYEALVEEMRRDGKI